MINKLKNYEEVYSNLMNDLTSYVRSIGGALDELDGDTHSDVWDRSCEYRDLWMCELVNVHNYGDSFIAYFNYHDRYENYDDSFRVIVRDWGSMSFGEIAEDIISRSKVLLTSEKNFEIDRLKRRLELLESD